MVVKSNLLSVNQICYQFNRYYGHGWASVLMQFVPKLRFVGVPEETIRKILVDNPRRFLAFVLKA